MTETMVRCDGLVQVYGLPGQEVTALRGVDLTVTEAETVALLGPSGAGKSTLLWLFAGLLRPTAGIVEICGKRLTDLTPKAAADMRLRDVGFVMQNPGRNLLPYESAVGNVLLAQVPTRRRWTVKRKRAMALLDSVGLARYAHRPAGRLSGGEQQRLALAVALANGPKLLLADEPTSQLDHESAAMVIELLKAANKDLGSAVVVVTHDQAVGSALSRTITIRDGRVGSEGHFGEDYLVVSKDGSVQLPTEVIEGILPPGSLVRAIVAADGVDLRRVDMERG
ncbi:MAG TPA: ABC transporter ATP-binding protein [Streptosporangiaceae bacterium]|jgi:ABC-type lipoprotein export system ATPase subunit